MISLIIINTQNAILTIYRNAIETIYGNKEQRHILKVNLYINILFSAFCVYNK